jgi:hypothetical protein
LAHDALHLLLVIAVGSLASEPHRHSLERPMSNVLSVCGWLV